MSKELEALSKPLTQLVDHVASAVGVLYEPTKIRKKAKAEADALITKKQSELLSESIENRAKARQEIQEIRRQANIENIIEKSVKYLNHSNNKDIGTEQDWLADFFNNSQDISDDNIQEIWAKVLASECNNRGSFSLKTLQIIKTLNRESAELIKLFYENAVKINNSFFVAEFVYRQPNTKMMLDFSDIGIEKIKILTNLNIIRDRSFSEIFARETSAIMYYGKEKVSIKIRTKQSFFYEALDTYFTLYETTKEANEISLLIDSTRKNTDYFDFLIHCLSLAGVIISK